MNRLGIDQGKRFNTDLLLGLPDSRGKLPTDLFPRDSIRRYISDGVSNALLMYVGVNVVDVIMTTPKYLLPYFSCEFAIEKILKVGRTKR